MLTQSKVENRPETLRLLVSHMNEGAQTPQLLFGVSFYGVQEKDELAVVVQAFNLSTKAAEASGSLEWRSGLYREFRVNQGYIMRHCLTKKRSLLAQGLVWWFSVLIGML